MVGKAYWKGLCLPSILYAAEVIEYTDSEINKLQVIENSVYRTILGARKFSPVATLRGEIGASLMKSRIDKNKLNFVNGILNLNRDDLVRRAMEWALHTNIGKWSRNVKNILEKYEIDINNMNRGIIKDKIKLKDTIYWHEDMRDKNTLNIYKNYKEFREESNLYDNTFSSEILYKLRSNTLELNKRIKFKESDDETCPMCKINSEDLYHFILFCPNLGIIRNRNILLQYPLNENKEFIIKNFLFFDKPSNLEIKNTKLTIEMMWKERKRYVNTT